MDVDTETEITITCGGTEAMAAVMLAVVDPGEEVIVMEPFYENYGPDAACEAQPVFLTLEAPEYRIEKRCLKKWSLQRREQSDQSLPTTPPGVCSTKKKCRLSPTFALSTTS